MNIIKKLSDVGTFEQLGRLSAFERLKSLAEAGADIFERIERARQEVGDTLSADEIEEIRPLMDRIVPRAIAAGRDLDAKLERAKNS